MAFTKSCSSSLPCVVSCNAARLAATPFRLCFAPEGLEALL